MARHTEPNTSESKMSESRSRSRLNSEVAFLSVNTRLHKKYAVVSFRRGRTFRK